MEKYGMLTPESKSDFSNEPAKYAEKNGFRVLAENEKDLVAEVEPIKFEEDK
jgi:hypothetical protein